MRSGSLQQSDQMSAAMQTLKQPLISLPYECRRINPLSFL